MNVNWLFIVIKEFNNYYGGLIANSAYNFSYSTDIEVDIEDMPLREDLDKFVSILNEGTKMGLL